MLTERRAGDELQIDAQRTKFFEAQINKERAAIGEAQVRSHLNLTLGHLIISSLVLHPSLTLTPHPSPFPPHP